MRVPGTDPPETTLASPLAMDHKQLAFTLLKTVVSARDAGREPPPPVGTTWSLIRGELTPAERALSDEVVWSRDRQVELRALIGSLSARFDADPELAGETEGLLRNLPGAEPDVTSPTQEKRTTLPPLGVVVQAAATTAPTDQPTTPQFPEVSTSGKTQQSDVLASARTRPTPPLPPSPPGLAPPQPAALAPRSRTLLVGSVLAVALSLASAAVVVTLRRGDAPVGREPSAQTEVASTPTRPPRGQRGSLPLPGAEATAQTSEELRRAGAYREAWVAQRERVEQLDDADAPPAERSAAYVELATLSAANGSYLDAVEAQREGLELAYEAGAARGDVLALSRHHLALGRYYHLTGQTTIARAHLRQARHYAGQAQDIAQADDLTQDVDELAAALSEGS